MQGRRGKLLRTLEGVQAKTTAYARRVPRRMLNILIVAVVAGSLGSYFLMASHAVTQVASVEAESGTASSVASSVGDTTASSARAVKFGGGTVVSSGSFPDGTNRPHMTSATVMAYSDANGVAQTITLKPLPTPGSTFGTNSSGTPNNCATYDARGWVDAGANCVIDGYNFDGVSVGNIKGSNVTISRNWFHNQDGQDSYAIWTHSFGALSGLTIVDNLANGTSGTGGGFITQLLHMDGNISNVVIIRNHVYNAGGFVQFSSIYGSGTAPYGNIVADNYTEVLGGESAYGWHLEQINVSSGTGGLLISHNHFNGPNGQTATIYICHDAGSVGNVTIDNNLLDGKPQNTIYAGDTGAAQGSLISGAGNMKITNNKFANTGGQNPGGLVIEPSPGDSRLSISGNVNYPALTPISGM